MDAFRSHATHPGPRLDRREKLRWGKWRTGAAKELQQPAANIGCKMFQANPKVVVPKQLESRCFLVMLWFNWWLEEQLRNQGDEQQRSSPRRSGTSERLDVALRLGRHAGGRGARERVAGLSFWAFHGVLTEMSVDWLSLPQQRLLFRSLDANRDGRVDLAELRQLAQRRGQIELWRQERQDVGHSQVEDESEEDGIAGPEPPPPEVPGSEAASPTSAMYEDDFSPMSPAHMAGDHQEDDQDPGFEGLDGDGDDPASPVDDDDGSPVDPGSPVDQEPGSPVDDEPGSLVHDEPRSPVNDDDPGSFTAVSASEGPLDASVSMESDGELKRANAPDQKAAPLNGAEEDFLDMTNR
eukprot:Skav202161  [mRNA]  locus=scaffold970:321368:331189:- [translate_table: standard]